MPVVSKGRLIGVVSRSDVARQLLVAQGLAYSLLHSYRDHTGINDKADTADTALREAQIIGSRLADTIQSLLSFRGPGAKMVVWEHNSHVGDARATEMAARGEHNVGSLCRAAY